jgi:hypothetical protein
MKTRMTPATTEPQTGREIALPRRFVLRTKTALRGGLRLLPAALLLTTVITTAPAAGATGCVPRSSNVIANGGNSRNVTNLDISADGGTALADADGGDDNLALAIFGLANAGNGGEADASADGGTVIVGDVTSGNHRGNSLNVGSSGRSSGRSSCGGGGNTIVNGGNSVNETDIDISADGGTAVADAEGGDNNVAVATVGIANAGNGGEADASADGGTVIIGDVNSGGNSGNDIDVD